MIRYTVAKTDLELQQILSLQKANLPDNLSDLEIESQGFVTVSHDFDLLAAMNAKEPHIIAKSNDEVIGYALVMLETFKNQIPILAPMFEQIRTIHYKGKPMSEMAFFIMGQVCIAKPFRGQGVFQGLFDKMKEEMSTDYQMVVTEVATRNVRSVKAHAKVGFETIREYQEAGGGEQWEIIAWDWK